MTDKETQRKLDKLQALENGGVDNWDNYDDSLEGWRKENHVDECIEDAIEGISDVLVEAEVDEPVGHGAGYAVRFDEEAMAVVLRKLLDDAKQE